MPVTSADKDSQHVVGNHGRVGCFEQEINSLIAEISMKAMALLLGATCLLQSTIPSNLFAQSGEETRLKASTFAGLQLRNIGPAVQSGRIADIVKDPTNQICCSPEQSSLSSSQSTAASIGSNSLAGCRRSQSAISKFNAGKTIWYARHSVVVF